MISPFEYDPNEWTERPKTWLDRFVYQNKLAPYDITYKSIDLEGSEAYLATLVLGDREFTLGSYYRSASIAQVNVIILALINITGYCETAAELQMLLASAISKGTFATHHNSRRTQLTRSLDTYSDEPYISPKEIKENVKLVLQHSDEYLSTEQIAKILRDEYGIRVSKKSIKNACFGINKDKMGTHSFSSVYGVGNIQYTPPFSIPRSSKIDSCRAGINRDVLLKQNGTDFVPKSIVSVPHGGTETGSPHKREGLYDNSTERNLLLREMNIGTMHVTAVTSSVVVYIPDNRTILNTKRPQKVGQGCYVVPFCEYESSMGRACWVYSTNDKTVYLHPCKIMSMNPSGLCYEPQFIPNDKNLQDYANDNNHLILLGVLIIAHM